jgi:hypothetical protein
MAEESGVDGAEGPQGICRTEKQRAENRTGLGAEGDRHGETLTRGATFSQSDKNAWYMEYEQKRRAEFSKANQSTEIVMKLDPSIIRTLGASCFSTGGWYVIEGEDMCKFIFRAGYRSDSRKGETVTPVRLTVSGGKCSPWPANASLGPAGDLVTCYRSGKNPVTVSLLTREKGTIGGVFENWEAKISPEPMLSTQETPELSTVVELGKYRDFDLLPKNTVDCWNQGNCKQLRHAVFSAGVADSVITRVEPLGCSEGDCSHWWPCSGHHCSDGGLEAFTASDYKRACGGEPTCHAWYMYNDANDNKIKIRVYYKIQNHSCVNCPPGVDIETAHKQWQDTKKHLQDEANRGCQQFADPDPQELRTGVYHVLDKIIP